MRKPTFVIPETVFGCQESSEITCKAPIFVGSNGKNLCLKLDSRQPKTVSGMTETKFNKPYRLTWQSEKINPQQ
jgi:hypothetical protein